MIDKNPFYNLGIKFNYHLMNGVLNSIMFKPFNLPLELHCYIVKTSISNHKENNNSHCEEELLFIFNNVTDNLLVQPTSISYTLMNKKKKIQNIQWNIFDNEWNISNRFIDFVVYLSLINE